MAVDNTRHIQRQELIDVLKMILTEDKDMKQNLTGPSDAQIEAAINKAIAEGKISAYDDTEIREVLKTVDSTVSGTEIVKGKQLTGDMIGYITDGTVGDVVELTTTNTVYISGKNLLPFNIASYDSNLTTVDETEDSLTVKIQPNATFKHFKLSPIFLKSGTYTVSRKVEIVSGDTISNAGTIYIYTGDTESSQTTNKKVFNKDSELLTLEKDCWVLVDIYANTNSSFTNETTIKFSGLQIEKSDTASEYEKYKGYSKTDSCTIMYFDNMLLYSTSNFSIKYDSQSKTLLSLDEVRTLATSNNEEITNIKNLLNVSDYKLIVAYGDSLTNGTGSDIAKPSSDTNSNTSYPAVLQRKLGNSYTVVNAGVGGEPSWMIAARQGGMPVSILPNTIPATKTKTRVYLKGMEQDAYYDKDTGKWTYSLDTLSYNIATENVNARVNPCKICGVEGTLTRELISSGSPDPDTGETVQSNTYAYYFTRAEEGDAVTFDIPKQLITYACEQYRDAISIIWAGQNDAPKINNKYFTQIGTHNRIRQMIEHLNNNKYIVIF